MDTTRISYSASFYETYTNGVMDTEVLNRQLFKFHLNAITFLSILMVFSLLTQWDFFP